MEAILSRPPCLNADTSSAGIVPITHPGAYSSFCEQRAYFNMAREISRDIAQLKDLDLVNHFIDHPILAVGYFSSISNDVSITM